MIVETAPTPAPGCHRGAAAHRPRRPTGRPGRDGGGGRALPLASSEMNTYITLTYGMLRAAAPADDMITDLAIRIPACSPAWWRPAAARPTRCRPNGSPRSSGSPTTRRSPPTSSTPAPARRHRPGVGRRGPAAAVETVNAYQHDSGVSRTWMLTLAPRGTVRSRVLRGMLEAAPGPGASGSPCSTAPSTPPPRRGSSRRTGAARSSWPRPAGHGAGPRGLRGARGRTDRRRGGVRRWTRRVLADADGHRRRRRNWPTPASPSQPAAASRC